MTFRTESVDGFLQLFEERKTAIRNFPGCSHLELWQDIAHPGVLFTYSHWESEAYLDRYRFSPLFKDTWSRVKPLFSGKAEAWSVTRNVVLA